MSITQVSVVKFSFLKDKFKFL